MLTALVLVCSLAATPDLRDCNETNAVDVMRVPDTFGSPALCFMQGQAYVAQTVLGREPRRGQPGEGGLRALQEAGAARGLTPARGTAPARNGTGLRGLALYGAS